MTKKTKYLLLFFVFVIFIFSHSHLIYFSLFAKLPRSGNSVLFYANQCRQDLKTMMIQAIGKAKKSLHLVTFGLTDPSVLQALEKKAKTLSFMKVFYDKRGSAKISLPNKVAIALKKKGLIHQKILVIDEELVFIGSANMTRSSLMMHDNLVIGFYSPVIAKFLVQKTPFSSGILKTMIAGQKIEIFLLPDIQNKALFSLIDLLKNAKVSIKIAMFCLSHPLLIEEIIKAHQRGVCVKVFLDKKLSKGISSKALEKLKKEKIAVFTNGCLSLFHHKFILVDKRHLVFGSANWTKSAFKKNNDCFVILYNLRKKQKKFMKKLNQVISLESS